MTTEIKNGLLDMDGIVTNWNKRMCELHSQPDPYLNPENYGKFQLEELFGISADTLWEVAEEDFWSSLELTEEAHDIVRLTEDRFGRENVYFLSSPSRNFYCEAGKKRWLKKYYPDYFYNRRYMFGHPKFLCAKPTSLLIDDYSRNYYSFTESGGQCFLFPRPWNHRYEENGRGLGLLKEFLSGL